MPVDDEWPWTPRHEREAAVDAQSTPSKRALKVCVRCGQCQSGLLPGAKLTNKPLHLLILLLSPG